MHDERFSFRPVTNCNWADLVTLFEGRGGPKHCWCTVWRKKPPTIRTADKTERRELQKAVLHEDVRRGRPVGILAYAADKPVAWCSIAPRNCYRPLGGVPEARGESESVWSLVCFFISSPYRRMGLKRKLLKAAIKTARDFGATAVEAYPADQDSPSYGFMGRVEFFKSENFEILGRVGSRRRVARLEIAESPIDTEPSCSSDGGKVDE